MAFSQLYDQPLIGILTFPASLESEGSVPEGNYTSFIDASYVKWVEGAGGRVVPVPYDTEPANLGETLSNLNGLIFTGGPAMPEADETYFSTAAALFVAVEDLNKNGVHFPLWGTCLGLETISSIVGGGQGAALTNFDAENISLVLDFTSEARSSKMFSEMPEGMYEIFSTRNITTNWHTFGVSPETFAARVQPAGFTLLSTNADKENEEFVSTFEHETYPIFAVQWHPESNQYDTTDKEGDSTPDRTKEAVEGMQYLGNFLVNEARGNDNAVDGDKQFRDLVLVSNSVEGRRYFDGWKFWFNDFA